MKKLALLASAAVFSAFASTSSASAATTSLQFSDVLLESNTQVTSPVRSGNFRAGEIEMIADGTTTFIAWCLDIADNLLLSGKYDPKTIGGGEQIFEPNDLDSPDNRTSIIQEYFDQNLHKVSDGTRAAAFQLGLWEIVYETYANIGDTTSGILRSTTAGVTALANAFLGDIGGTDSGYSYNLTFLDAFDPEKNQDLVTATLPDGFVGQVPLPAAGWLLGAGLFGLFGAGRLKKLGNAQA